MKAFALARIGRDVEVRQTPSGESVVNLSLAINYGRKGQDGKRPTQWVEGSFWGKRAEALAPYLLKGSQISVTLEDVHIETYAGKTGEGHKLVARVFDVELIAGQSAASAPAATRPATRPAAKHAAPAGSGFEDMEDSIPF